MLKDGRAPTAIREIELDFVRGLAILFVVDFHSPLQWFFKPFTLLGFSHFGWLGVDLFFVLSGFLVGGLLVKEWKLRGRVDSGRFLVRRGLKIWPPYYVLMAAMLVTGHRGWHELRGNLLNIQNYTGGVSFTWSLAVEEHAYLLLVLLLAVAAKYTLRMRSLFVFLASLSVGVVVLRMVLTVHGYQTFIATHTRIEGILYGVMLAMLYHYLPEQFLQLQRRRWLWVGVLIAGLTLLRFDAPQPWVGSIRIDAANFMSIAILMLLYQTRKDGRTHSLPYRLVAWVGLYSYGIYLWHVSVIAPIAKLAGRVPHPWRVLIEGVGPMAASIVLGVVMTKLIEFPTLKLRDKLFPRRIDSAVGVPAIVEAEEDAVESLNRGTSQTSIAESEMPLAQVKIQEQKPASVS